MTMLRIIVPVLLGIAAAVLNFLILRGNVAPVELTVLRADVKADMELSEEMLDRLSVRADKDIFKSVVPYSKRGLMLHRRVTRPISAGEVLLYTDVQNLEEENIRLYLNPGEVTLTIPVKRVAPGLRKGDLVGVWVKAQPAMESMKTRIRAPAVSHLLGPFRLISVGTPHDSSRSSMLGGEREVVVAIKTSPKGQTDPNVAALQEAIALSLSSNREEGGVQSVEYYEAAK